MEDTREIIARNIAKLRVKKNMTQLQLAEKLNYSDKAVSKWERGESVPDIAVLAKMAELFGVSLDYLVRDIEEPDEKAKPQKTFRYSHRIIKYISECFVELLAMMAFVVTTLITGKTGFAWLYFVYSVPVVLIVSLVFNSIWLNRRMNYLIISGLMWSIFLAVQLSIWWFLGENVSKIYLMGIFGQIIIILWAFMKRPKKKEKQ